jgi:hypothetical protein
MQTFGELFKSLYEAGNNPSNIEWIKNNSSWEGTFRIGIQNFSIIIGKNNNYCDNVDVWEFKFTREGSTKMFNDGEYSFIVVPTIKKAIREFLNEMTIDVLAFIGNKQDKGRVRIYTSEAKKLSEEYNFRVDIGYDESDYATFVLYESDELLDCMEALRKMKYDTAKELN